MKEGRMCARFVDFRAAFDMVDRENLWVYEREGKERERNKRMTGTKD
jgi:hypothetical protein